jgi:hypothetical protein
MSVEFRRERRADEQQPARCPISADDKIFAKCGGNDLDEGSPTDSGNFA